MRLTDLMAGAGLPDALTGLDIAGISADSRAVAPGFLFAALPGRRVDGRHYVADAIERGAVLILAPDDEPLEAGVPVLFDPDPRRLLALMAARWHPGQPDTLAAVTGTNGKTSVVDYLRQILTALDRPAASLGTMGVIGPDFEDPLPLTTPDPMLLHRRLAELADRGLAYAAIEASSHGLDQRRLDGIRVSCAAFTNLSRDHLDYHATAEDYFQAKLRLFTAILDPAGTAILNADSLQIDRLREACAERGVRTVEYGEQADEVRLTGYRPVPDGLVVNAEIGGRAIEVSLSLVGAFQAWNVLCAIALARAVGCDDAAVIEALPALRGVRGRLQRIGSHPAGARVYVDFAHTPDALENALQALRPYTENRLVVLFGCGGDRDRGKRPQMGRIAAGLADRAIVTDDNPRSEYPAAIRQEILAACPDALEVADRGEAIRLAVGELGAGDVLLVAGKGHERGQEIAGVVRPFEDSEQVLAALAERDGGDA